MNIRSGPGATYADIGDLYLNDVVEGTVTNNWWNISKINGVPVTRASWASGAYITQIPAPVPDDSEILTAISNLDTKVTAIKSEVEALAGVHVTILQKLDAILEKVNSTTPPPPDPIVSDGYIGASMGIYKIIEAPDQQTGNALTIIQDRYGNEVTIVMDKMVAWMEANCPGWSNFVSNGSVVKGSDGFWRYEVKLVKGQLVRIAEVGGKTTANPLGNGRIVGMDSEGSPTRGAALGIAAEIAANVINGAACCGKHIKDDIEQPGLFDEWLIEVESMHEAMASLKNFDEEAGESS